MAHSCNILQQIFEAVLTDRLSFISGRNVVLSQTNWVISFLYQRQDQGWCWLSVYKVVHINRYNRNLCRVLTGRYAKLWQVSWTKRYSSFCAAFPCYFLVAVFSLGVGGLGGEGPENDVEYIKVDNINIDIVMSSTLIYRTIVLTR